MSNELEQIKNILANFAVHVNKCHKDGSEPNLNPWADLFESLLSKQRVSLIKEFEGVIGEDETESKKDKMGFNNLWKHRNLLRIQQRRRLKAIKDTNEDT